MVARLLERCSSRRLPLVAHSREQAKAQGERRDAQIGEIEQLAERLVERLNAQDAGRPGRRWRLSDSVAYAQVRQAVQEAGLGRIVHTDVDGGQFFYDTDTDASEQARPLDGKLILVINVKDLRAAQIVTRYKSVADIERGFRVLKSDVEIAPVYHRLPGRIRAHASISFPALVLHRVMRLKLRQAGSTPSPSGAIELAQRIHYPPGRHSSSPPPGRDEAQRRTKGPLRPTGDLTDRRSSASTPPCSGNSRTLSSQLDLVCHAFFTPARSFAVPYAFQDP